MQVNTTARPRFRTNLVAEPVEEGGHRYIDVVDPDTGAGFRFYDVEYSLACAMDGERDVAGLVVWAKEELGIEPSSNELATVISTLDDLGYLADGAAAAEPELGRGVVAAPRSAPAAPVEDVELGYGGGAPAALDAPLPAGDFELGAGGGISPSRVPAHDLDAGGGPELGAAGSQRESVMEFEAPTPPPAEMPYATMRPSTRPDAEEDGPTNLPPAATADFDDDEVSVNLSDHLAISASDVKEAVRASKVMKAVDLPPELAAQLESSEQQLAASREAAERASAEREAAEREAAERASLERAAAERLAAEAARPPVELPRAPVGVSRPKAPSDRPLDKGAAVVAKEPATQPQKRGTSWVLIVLLLLVAAAAGGYYYWVKVLEKPLPWEKADPTASTGTGPATAGPGTAAVQPPPPPPPPAPPSAQLVETAAPPSDVTAGQVGVVGFVAAAGATVASGDALVRFNGNPAWENKLKGLDYDIDLRVPKQLADATKARDAATAAGRAGQAKVHETYIAERTARLEQKTAERNGIHAAQEALTVKAPVAGVVAIKVAKGARTKADQVVATVSPVPVLSATFTIPAGGKSHAVDASVRVAVKATPETKANCTVSAVAGAAVTVVCPADAGIASGTDVILE